MSSKTPAKTKRAALMSPKSTATKGGWRAKVRKGMREVCKPEMADEALQMVMDAPDAKVDAARDEFCRPYKPANWPEFLRATLGAAAAARLLDASPASPVASPRRRLASPVASPVASPPASPRRGRPSAAALAAPTQPTALDYAALSVVGMMIAVVAAFVAPGGAARFEDGFRQVAAAAAAAGVDAEAIRWVTKVLTVGGTLALSGGVAGAIILAMASVVVYAVFAKAR